MRLCQSPWPAWRFCRNWSAKCKVVQEAWVWVSSNEWMVKLLGHRGMTGSAPVPGLPEELAEVIRALRELGRGGHCTDQVWVTWAWSIETAIRIVILITI